METSRTKSVVRARLVKFSDEKQYALRNDGVWFTRDKRTKPPFFSVRKQRLISKFDWSKWKPVGKHLLPEQVLVRPCFDHRVAYVSKDGLGYVQ